MATVIRTEAQTTMRHSLRNPNRLNVNRVVIAAKEAKTKRKKIIANETTRLRTTLTCSIRSDLNQTKPKKSLVRPRPHRS